MFVCSFEGFEKFVVGEGLVAIFFSVHEEVGITWGVVD